MADQRAIAYATAAVVFALDRFTKWLIESHVRAYDTIRVIPGFFNIVHSENSGMAFSNCSFSLLIQRLIDIEAQKVNSV